MTPVRVDSNSFFTGNLAAYIYISTNTPIKPIHGANTLAPVFKRSTAKREEKLRKEEA